MKVNNIKISVNNALETGFDIALGAVKSTNKEVTGRGNRSRIFKTNYCQ